jgi:hypothetical protein
VRREAPSMGWLCVPGLADSNSDSDSRSEIPTAPSLTVRGMVLPLRSWRRAWRTAPWMGPLSGTISQPSMADAGVESWIALLRATRASRSPLPGSAKGPMTRATFGPTSPASSGKWSPYRCSWRTSPATCVSASERSLPTFEEWATRLRRVCLQRRKSAHRTGERGSLRWPTATALLIGPDATYNRPGQAQLDLAAKTWATPTSHDGHRLGSDASSTQGQNLKREAERWPTVTANEDSYRLRSDTQQSKSLESTCRQWATPTKRDWKAGDTPALSLQAPESGIGGRGSLNDGQNSPRRLNPQFVTWLMGLPPGWTDYAPVETQSFRSWLHTHTELLRGL